MERATGDSHPCPEGRQGRAAVHAQRIQLRRPFSAHCGGYHYGFGEVVDAVVLKARYGGDGASFIISATASYAAYITPRAARGVRK